MEYVRNTDFTSAACTEICYEKVSYRETNQPSLGSTNLCFPQNLAPGPDPRNEDEFLTLSLLIIRVRDTGIGEGGFGGI